MRIWLIVVFILSFQISLGVLSVIPVMDSYYPNQTAVIDLNNSTIMLQNTSLRTTDYMLISPDMEAVNNTNAFNNDTLYIPILYEIYTITVSTITYFSFVSGMLLGVGSLLEGLGFPSILAWGVQAGIWATFGVALVQVIRGISGKTME